MSTVMAAEPKNAEVAVVAVGSIVVAALSWLPAGDVRVGETTRSIRFTDLVGVGWVFAAASLGLGLAAVIEAVVLKRRSTVATIGFSALALLTMIWIIAIEGVGRLIPTSLLPKTVRRFAVGLGARPASWFALTLLVVIVLASGGWLVSALKNVPRHANEDSREFAMRIGLVVALVIGAVVVGFSREVPLANVEWVGGKINVDPWAVPYIGPGSLALFFALLVSVAAVTANWRSTAFGVLGAACAWAIAASSALVVATSGLIAESGIVKWAARRIGETDFSDAATVSARPGAAIALIGACIAGVAFAGHLAFVRDDR